METNKFITLMAVLSVAVFLAGCQSTVEDIESNYRRVLYEDGINQNEAVSVAQMKLTLMPYTKAFNKDKPRVIRNDYTKAYPNLWFVSFPPMDVLSGIEYLIVLDKFNGGVIRSTEYSPDVQYKFDWLFK